MNDFIDWYYSGGDGPRYLWMALGVVMLGLFVLIGDNIIRRSLGHRKFMGTWYNENQFRELVQMTYEKQQAGNRVMLKQESELLRRYQLGTRKGLSRDSGMRF